MEKTYTKKEYQQAISLNSGIAYGTGMILSAAIIFFMKTEDKKTMGKALVFGGIGIVVVTLILQKIDS